MLTIGTTPAPGRTVRATLPAEDDTYTRCAAFLCPPPTMATPAIPVPLNKNPAMPVRSSQAGLVIAIRKALDATGVDGAGLLVSAGIDVAQLSTPGMRVPMDATARLWRLAVDATHDPAFGLEVARRIALTSFSALGFALMASPTLKDVFGRVARYAKVVNDAVDVALEHDTQAAEYRLRIGLPTHGPVPTDEGVDVFVSLLVRMARARLGSAFAPKAIYFHRAAPPEPEAFRRVLRAPLFFSAPETVVIFDAPPFERVLEGGDADLARHNDTLVQKDLARLGADGGDIVTRARGLIVERLPEGEPAIEDIADLLYLSPRSLQRRLADAGSGYRELLDTVRRELAAVYVENPRYTLTETAFLLGFADARSFSRAYRRWHGVAPSAGRVGS